MQPGNIRQIALSFRRRCLEAIAQGHRGVLISTIQCPNHVVERDRKDTHWERHDGMNISQWNHGPWREKMHFWRYKAETWKAFADGKDNSTSTLLHNTVLFGPSVWKRIMILPEIFKKRYKSMVAMSIVILFMMRPTGCLSKNRSSWSFRTTSRNAWNTRHSTPTV